MEHTIIKAQVMGQTLLITELPKVASGGYNDTKVEFTFDNRWGDLIKTAMFYTDPARPYFVLLEADTAVVPHEVLANEGIVKFGVFGYSIEQSLTSEVLALTIAEGAITDSVKTGAYPPSDVYKNLVFMVEDSKAIALRVREDAEAGAFDGEDGANGLTPYIGTNAHWWIGDVDTGFEVVDTTAVNNARVVEGSYVGNGVGNVTLTFDHDPDVLFISGNKVLVVLFPKIGYGHPIYPTPSNSNNNTYTVTANNGTVTFSGINLGAGTASTTYRYVAICGVNPIISNVETVSFTLNEENRYENSGSFYYQKLAFLVAKGTTWGEFITNKGISGNNSSLFYVEEETGRIHWTTGYVSLFQTYDYGYIQDSEGNYVLGTDVITEGTYVCDIIKSDFWG